MSFLSTKFTKYGLIDTDDSPSTRVYVKDVHSDTSATLRQVPDRDTDTDGATIFAGFRSEVGLASADVSGVTQVETWMTDFSDVELVGITPDHLVQWYNPSRLTGTEMLDTTETNLAEHEVSMVQDGGDQQSHDVYITRNGLLFLAPENGGWADTDSSGVADGYTATDLTGTAFTSGVQEFYVDTGDGSGSINATLPFPIDGVTVTLSANHTQIHDDGSQAIRIEALDSSGSQIDFTDKSVSSTGRKFAELTTPSDTYELKVYPARVTGVSANTTKAKVKDPALRVDGGTSYVKR